MSATQPRAAETTTPEEAVLAALERISEMPPGQHRDELLEQLLDGLRDIFTKPAR